MSLPAERLNALIEFCQKSARLKGKPSATVSAHRSFSLYEDDLAGLPGVKLNTKGLDDTDEIWLSVDRLYETTPPEVTSKWLSPWLILEKGPDKEPSLKQGIDGRTLIDTGTHTEKANADLPQIDPNLLINFSDYPERYRVVAALDEYIKKKWIPWAIEEKKRIKTILLYRRLFTLKQQLEDGIVDAQLELVWGIGLGIWKTLSAPVTYPLISQLVELSLNPTTASLEVRPRDTNPRIELDWYADQDNAGTADLEKIAKKFFEELQYTLSPFDRNTFEPLLTSAVNHLDANGIYWPWHTPAEDRTLPKADDKLKITDTWVLFARPRTNSTYLQDLERLRAATEDLEKLPPAVAALFTDPDNENPEIELPVFRGVSSSYHSDNENRHSSHQSYKAKDLYFPKPFNDEQVRIIQLLERFDSVVVQGPPGTGKTHTIANVICHYLASGKRVLVTSMKDPALGVLSNQLPDEIQPLAISLLTSEREGLKKFEHSITKIATEIQSIDRSATSKDICHLEESIDDLHGKLMKIDWNIAAWAKKNLSKISIDSIELDPADAAKQLANNQGMFEWIPDALNITAEYEPRFNNQDIKELREARLQLGNDLIYLNASLPQFSEFPDSKSILQTHQDLSRFEQLKREVEKGSVPDLRDTSQETITAASTLKADIDELKEIRNRLDITNHSWLKILKNHVSDPAKNDIKQILDQLGVESETTRKQRKIFLTRPVNIPPDFETNQELVNAVKNLAEGKRPFSLITGLFGKAQEKKILGSIQVMGNRPSTIDDWKHIKEYVLLQKHLRELVVRWNGIAQELQLPTLNVAPHHSHDVQNYLTRYKDILQELHLEQQIYKKACEIFSTWPNAKAILTDNAIFEELDSAIKHHLTKNRLANVWANKEQFQKILEGCSGPVVDSIRNFSNQTLGNPAISDTEMQTAWSALMSELSRILGQQFRLDSVKRITNLISESGAPEYAARLHTPPTNSTVDELLPNNWEQCWRLKRLDTYLKEIDAQTELKQLSQQRKNVEQQLSKSYQDVIVKRTWLKLAENASPNIRSALQAYLSAIQKIGKGTGKRAARYRQDARQHAALANPAVPCWIMPHYRISESLPAKIGDFDLVIIDEASQSDLTALPAILRAQKVLIVGDDKQVSPEGIGLEEEKIRALIKRFLEKQVETYRPQMSPERSIYDLFKVVHARSTVMLREHFRCVAPIIEYAKREFYNHELRPLRLPHASERLDPPLIDVLVQEGYRDGDENRAEARFIVEEIKQIVSDEKYANRSIGVVSLLADKQAYLIWNMLTEELGPEYLQRHQIACGDARTFQGKERDIMFLSMVVAPNESRISPLTRNTYAQRFNVASSRARDRMYLVRSVDLEHLSEADKFRRTLINHFHSPFAQDEDRQKDLRQLCESPFECEVYDALTERGFWVTPQVKVGQFRIDMVVEGNNDTRLAIECDGDRYHGPDKWDDDMHRQRILERAGWVFWRCFASKWFRDKNATIDDLVHTLTERGIEPIGAKNALQSIYTEHRVITDSEIKQIESPINSSDALPANTIEESEKTEIGLSETAEITELNNAEALPSPASQGQIQIPVFLPPEKSNTSIEAGNNQTIQRAGLEVKIYSEFQESLSGDPREINSTQLANGLIKIIHVEGPIIAERACKIYLRSVGIQRMGHEIRAKMRQALRVAIQNGQIEPLNETDNTNLMNHTIKLTGKDSLIIRTRGNRQFEEITPGEIQFIAKYLEQKEGLLYGSDEHLREILEFFEMKRLTIQVKDTIRDILKRNIPHVDTLLEHILSEKPGIQ